ncbi:hypothetical protein F3Y22_tig00117047pilonHSYRG00015 [Hibiscus syriacus]|uniref:At1g68980-like TPR repeats domain-containing protein n=1 Tax=Hibiscus syriacus TaxID=106335 RepID=A0A6A2W9Q7_HIBSY|nr:hypothetical protein F3Y22_tig00117047pilonHSYRG00015 [Hibiscus syriacus]
MNESDTLFAVCTLRCGEKQSPHELPHYPLIFTERHPESGKGICLCGFVIETVTTLLSSMSVANTPAPAFALVKCIIEEQVSDAEKVVATMSFLGVRPDETSFDKQVLYNSLIGGYVKSGSIDLVSATILRCLREGNGKDLNFNDETFCQVVKGYIQTGVMKSLASLIIEAQKLESPLFEVDKSIGYGIISACINLGLSDKAHSFVGEMNAQGGSVGLGVFVPILKAYGKDIRTAEATQLVMDISTSGLQLDTGMYDMLIEASMTSQDFPSAFTLFRDMRGARIDDLKGSYLTIMTGLMENQRPELMAAFLDVVEDPRIEIKTHDWNSIIHAFCKAGAGKASSSITTWLMRSYMLSLKEVSPYAVMQVVERSQEMKIFVDKWRYKQAFMEKHKKLKVSQLRRSFRKMKALIAFKNWAGLNA